MVRRKAKAAAQGDAAKDTEASQPQPQERQEEEKEASDDIAGASSDEGAMANGEASDGSEAENEEEGKDSGSDESRDDGSDGDAAGVGDDDEEDDAKPDPRDFRARMKEGRRSAPTAAAANGSEEGADGAQAAGAELHSGGSFVSDGAYRNKQRVLVFCSRGITSRYRHLMEDLRRLLPHHKKDVKLDIGRGESLAGAVKDICDMKSCNGCLFLECRKKQDLYLWMGRMPHGPSAKFLVLNVHTMDELKLTGNCMLGSRPVLSFDKGFDTAGPQWALLKAVLAETFGAPRGHPKTKPFVDRVMSFFVADGKIWVRNYQILEAAATTALERRNAKADGGGDGGTSLVEIGPRFVLEPIRVFAGAFGGPTLFQNSSYVSPNASRASRKRVAGERFVDRTDQRAAGKKKREDMVLPRDELADIFK